MVPIVVKTPTTTLIQLNTTSTVVGFDTIMTVHKDLLSVTLFLVVIVQFDSILSDVRKFSIKN